PDAHFEIRELLEAVKDAIFGQRGASRFQTRGHASPANRIASNRLGHAPGILLSPPLDQREVDFFDRPGGKLRCKRAMRRIGSSYQQHSARLLVDPMNDAGT